MNRQAVAQELVKVAKLLSASERVLATNSSSYSWEDFYSTATAKVYLDEATDKLRLEIRKDVENTGINPHKGSELAAELDLGTLQKPRLGGVPTLLKQHGHDRTTAGGPFPRLWTDVKRNSKEALAQIIKEELARKQPSSAVSSPATKPMPTPEDQAVLKQMLKNVDVATIHVEDAQEEIERAITTGDRKKVEYALGVMESATERLIGYAKSYKEVVRHLA